jgi:hypothetical protein
LMLRVPTSTPKPWNPGSAGRILLAQDPRPDHISNRTLAPLSRSRMRSSRTHEGAEQLCVSAMLARVT